MDDGAVGIIRSRFSPFSGEAVALALSWVREDGFEILDRYELKPRRKGRMIR